MPLGVELFCWQLLDLGFYHCDPHFVSGSTHPRTTCWWINATRPVRHRLWQVCAEISAPARENMTKAMVHLIEGNVAALVDDAVDLDFLPDDIDRAALVPILGGVFDGARLAAKSMDGVPVQKRRKEFAAVSADLNNIFFEQPFRVPDWLRAGDARAHRGTEGIALSGDPSFDIFKAAYPHGLRRAGAVRRRRAAGGGGGGGGGGARPIDGHCVGRGDRARRLTAHERTTRVLAACRPSRLAARARGRLVRSSFDWPR